MDTLERGCETGEPGGPIVCPLSRWFFRRMAMLALLMTGLALYFLYDGAIGYPKKNFTADLYEAFDAGRSGLDWQGSGAEGKAYSDEQTAELGRAHQAGADGATWAGFAAGRLLPEKAPKRYTADEIREQYHFAVLLGVIALGAVLWTLFQRKKAFRCDREAIITPRGRTIPFSDVVRLDLKKWDRGIARLTVREGESDAETTVKVDDYKFSGTGRILRRLCANNQAVEILGDRRWISGGEEPPPEPEA